MAAPMVNWLSIGLVALVLVGGMLAAVVYAIARGKPGILLWTGGILFVALAALLMLTFVVNHRPMTRPANWTVRALGIESSDEIGGHESVWQEGGLRGELSWAEAVPQRVIGTRVKVTWLLTFAAMLVGGFLLMAKWLGSDRHANGVARHKNGLHGDELERRRGNGWAWALAIFLIPLLLLLNFSTSRVEFRSSADAVTLTQPRPVAPQPGEIKPAIQPDQPIEQIMNEFDKPRIVVTKGELDAPAATVGRGPSALQASSEEPAPRDSQQTVVIKEPGNSAEAAEGADEHSQGADEHSHTDKAATAAATPEPAPAAPPKLRVVFDRSKLTWHRLSFNEAASHILSINPGGVGFGEIRIDPDRLVIVVTDKAAKAINLDKIQFTVRGEKLPLQSVATIRQDGVQTMASGGRPAWVDQPMRRTSDEWSQVVVAGDFETLEECYHEADEALVRATYSHLMNLVGRPGPSYSSYSSYTEYRLAEIGVGLDFIRREIVPLDGQYAETISTSVGPMKRLYTLVVFTPEVNANLRQHWTSYQRRDRVAFAGVLGTGALVLVGMAWGLLKIDSWTKGYYTKRLFIGVPAVIIGIIALLALVAG